MSQVQALLGAFFNCLAPVKKLSHPRLFKSRSLLSDVVKENTNKVEDLYGNIKMIIIHL
jgi:hypothetical protein